jgi:SAM-dependent methyltransferase
LRLDLLAGGRQKKRHNRVDEKKKRTANDRTHGEKGHETRFQGDPLRAKLRPATGPCPHAARAPPSGDTHLRAASRLVGGPCVAYSTKATATDGELPVDNLQAMYSAEIDMPSLPAFASPFMNFGYWALDRAVSSERARNRAAPLFDTPLTHKERHASGRDLYRLVLDALRPHGIVVDVGCGVGAGCRLVAAEWRHTVDRVLGIDASPDHIARAKSMHDGRDGGPVPVSLSADGNAKGPDVRYVHGYSKDLPLDRGSVDCIYTVEALQHFVSPSDFVRGAARALKPGGRLAVCTFLATRPLTPEDHATISSRVRTVAAGIDRLVPVCRLEGMMHDAGLSVTRRHPIGDRVWGAFVAWCAQVQPESRWPSAWLAAYGAGLVDYFLVVAEKSAAEK